MCATSVCFLHREISGYSQDRAGVLSRKPFTAQCTRLSLVLPSYGTRGIGDGMVVAHDLYISGRLGPLDSSKERARGLRRQGTVKGLCI